MRLVSFKSFFVIRAAHGRVDHCRVLGCRDPTLDLGVDAENGY